MTNALNSIGWGVAAFSVTGTMLMISFSAVIKDINRWEMEGQLTKEQAQANIRAALMWVVVGAGIVGVAAFLVTL